MSRHQLTPELIEAIVAVALTQARSRHGIGPKLSQEGTTDTEPKSVPVDTAVLASS